ncbi:hypothetical protein J437_LFUL001686 [Ladona fulva]|uniref:Transposable element P transposase-like GTP-binding insertion domain-containing protein n=1 Tax=Ladona fulva TaxID=123851 RepID=A0A8K0K3R8_LADFU|nr:hypothetical protein J437_LFUL001686 [Ladona fulva]
MVTSSLSTCETNVATSFSNSVAQGLQLVHKHKVSGLEEIDGTADFCQQMNAMFDALNRNKPSLGVRVDSADCLVLKQSLVWLDDWETERNAGHICAIKFLTSTIAEGLRITLNSMIGMIPYLQKFGFAHVFKGKVNQDSLCVCLRFFCAVRIAAGANDHPAAVTFLQLYNLLAVYGVLKPP